MAKPKLSKLPGFRFLLLLILFIAFLIHSCKKDNNRTVDSSIKTDITAESIKQWLNKQNGDSTNAYTVNNLVRQANWTTAHTITVDSETYQIVSISTDLIYDDSTKTQLRYLVLITKGSVTSGFIFDLFGKRYELRGRTDNLITNFEKKTNLDFTGDIILSDWKNSIKKLKTYTSGINSVTKILVGKNSAGKKVIQGKNKKTNACIDWYWQTYIDGELVSEEYVFTTCEGEEVECDAIGQRDRKGILKIKMACGGNQGGGDDPNTVLLDSINAKPCNAMTYADQMDYIQTISNMNNGNCLQKALLHAFNDLGKQVTVCKGSTVNGAIAQTDYYSNTITWNSNLSFYEKTLDEEFFHNIQFGTYGNVNDHANIEFEAAIMCDMIQTSANYTAMDQQSTSVRNEYSTWLKSITNNGNSFPKSFTEMFPDDTAKQTYFYFLEKYRDQYQPGDSHYSPINYNLLPTAIFKVTSKSCN